MNKVTKRRIGIIGGSGLYDIKGISGIEEIESATVRPTWVPQAVTCDSTGYNLSVWGLYWGVFHMVNGLAKNRKQMQDAESRLRSTRLA